jgi:hypothetical protein
LHYGAAIVTLHNVERALHQMNRDEAAAREFQADPGAWVAAHGDGLSPMEQQALVKGDILALYRMGVHALLIAPASRFFGMDQRALKDALAPAVGERRT